MKVNKEFVAKFCSSSAFEIAAAIVLAGLILMVLELTGAKIIIPNPWINGFYVFYKNIAMVIMGCGLMALIIGAFGEADPKAGMVALLVGGLLLIGLFLLGGGLVFEGGNGLVVQIAAMLHIHYNVAAVLLVGLIAIGITATKDELKKAIKEA